MDRTIKKVRYADLERVNEGELASKCPSCKEGRLCLARDSGTLEIKPYDCCTLCGCFVHYEDIDEVRSKDWATHTLRGSE